MASTIQPTSARPLDAGMQTPPPLATRPGRDPQGKPLSDKDVWGGIKTPTGEPVDTSDGINDGEGAALAELAVSNSVEFVQRLAADSENGTPVKYHFEKPFENVGTAFADFTAQDSNVLIECGISVESKTVKEALKEYLAPEDKQNDKPIVGKIKFTGKINEQGEIADIKCEASLGNLPKFSSDKIGEFEKTVAQLLEKLPTGQVITDEMKKDIGDRLKTALKRSSNFGVEFVKELMEVSRVFDIDVKSDQSSSVGHIKAGKNALDITVDHLLDEAGRGYPRIDGQTKVTLDEKDHDTVDLGTLRLFSTENLLVSFEGNKPRLFRIEKDGSRTELKDVFGQIIFGLPFIIALLAGKGIRF